MFNHIQNSNIEKMEAADKEFQDLKIKNEKNEYKIFMRNETKLKLKK
ncbi:hypothetical protein [Enterococcus faecium]|nr:hypothetical protein [Enterococcus faecium]MBK5028762.1 hypothetical protein [Enterococcus faecium]MBK5039461.1 hypothetical protein [Enterococcus faecium]MBK5044260.1 hypothetical protein [Enterococcus faecium]MBK5069222.1 hypothetical protein [Enterococcus faecium]MBK5132700.1 hypothetical protein [Enterococcus faecium]